jgi:glycosyltransferase involved in cell wall biosynthesis
VRLVCVSNNPFPYHTPILNELGRRSNLHVIYMSEQHPLGSFDDTWGVAPEFEHSLYWSRRLRWQTVDFRTQVSVGISARLARLSPDIIFFSSWGPLVWEPLIWKRRSGRGAVMWAESTAYSGLLRGRLANRIRRTILRNTDAFVSNGTQATAYLEMLGVPRAAIVTSCLPSPITARAVDDESPPGDVGPRFLFVGRLIQRKRVDLLLDAFAELLRHDPTATLTIVGDGPEHPRTEATAAALKSSVRLVGRKEGRALAAEYAQADILVVPSEREVWGLVVNEALAHGLYVVATDEVGSAHDLIQPGLGVMVRVGTKGALLDGLVQAAGAPRDAASRRARADSMSDKTPARFAEDILRACVLAKERSERARKRV